VLSVSVIIFEIFDGNFDDLDLGQFKVLIQGHGRGAKWKPIGGFSHGIRGI